MGERESCDIHQSGEVGQCLLHIPSGAMRQNVCASALADALCAGKSCDEIADIMRFLQLLCCLMKNYLV